jgi:hypothetical protein
LPPPLGERGGYPWLPQRISELPRKRGFQQSRFYIKNLQIVKQRDFRYKNTSFYLTKTDSAQLPEEIIFKKKRL